MFEEAHWRGTTRSRISSATWGGVRRVGWSGVQGVSGGQVQGRQRVGRMFAVFGGKVPEVDGGVGPGG
eukprot:3933540-Rhodomonas_salina.1